MRSVTGGSLPATIWHAVMTVAEKGLPSTKLDKSEAQPAVDTGIFSSTDTYTPSAGDDESGAGRYPGAQADRPPPEDRGNRSNFWDWLFNERGRDASGRPDTGQGDAQDESN
jgi:membrane peptidoglycan carboxypeptidase